MGEAARAIAERLNDGRCREIENQINAYCSNCKVTLTATHRLKPSRNPSQEGSITAYSLLFAAKRHATEFVALVPRYSVGCEKTERLTSSQYEARLTPTLPGL